MYKHPQIQTYHYPSKYKLYMRNYIQKFRLELINILTDNEPHCVVCGFLDVRALQIDHINGGGRLEIRKMGKVPFYRMNIKNPELAKKNLQVLCANCNWIKYYEDRLTKESL